MAVFETLNAEFSFTVDVAADASNAKCTRFYTESVDGLKQDWHGEVVWCNPPYGRGHIEQWAKKAVESSWGGATVVMLLPSDTGTKWFHDYCLQGEVRFIKGRLRFGGTSSSPKFANIVVIFRPKTIKFGRHCGRCSKPIRKHDKYQFAGSIAQHRNCSDPQLTKLSAELRQQRTLLDG